MVKYSKEHPLTRNILIIAVITISIGIAVASFDNGISEATPKGGIFNVKDVEANPNAYKGLVTITGVVAKFSKEDPKLFAIIDTAEAKHCKSTGCAKFYLPIRYDKEMPKQGDEINVTGQLIEKSGLLFEATKIEILRHLTLQSN